MDVHSNDLVNCLDGSKGCPVCGTLGSWGLYVLGIFMACVFQLGPKTKYGESEQNPAYWLQLLLTSKEPGTKVTWYDPIKDRAMECGLTARDGRCVEAFAGKRLLYWCTDLFVTRFCTESGGGSFCRS
jgi:hypothetical protein